MTVHVIIPAGTCPKLEKRQDIHISTPGPSPSIHPCSSIVTGSQVLLRSISTHAHASLPSLPLQLH